MEQTPKKNNSGKTSLVTIFGFFFLLIFIGGISLVLIKQNSDINTTLSTLSAAQSQFMEDLAVLSSDVGNLQTTTPMQTTDIPVHTLDISGSTSSSESTTPEPTNPPETTSKQEPTTPEPTTPEPTTPKPTTPQPTTPQPTTPEPTTPDTGNTVQEYVQMWLSNKEYRIPIIPSVPKHNYNWENIKVSANGLKYYTESGKKVSFEGVDVSSHQKDIDWAKVKAAGIDFAIIRVGFRGYGTGAIVPDEYFTKNIEGALAAGIKVGVYFFSQAINEAEAIEEAEFVIEQLKKYKNKITYPVVYDAEDISNDTARTDGLLGAQITSNCIAFCDKVKEAGYTPMIYANKRWFLTRLDLTRLTNYDLWHAAYVDAPDTPYMYTMWQYSSSGKVDGINGTVDLNISFKDYSKK
ncbi:MAG: hypothetical protein E7261_05160 [Lachnospiraceae bacterium]|nr:hypothetical protein [Lachnospiraceae bacterium]